MSMRADLNIKKKNTIKKDKFTEKCCNYFEYGLK